MAADYATRRRPANPDLDELPARPFSQGKRVFASASRAQDKLRF